jgi:hypothetical protein
MARQSLIADVSETMQAAVDAAMVVLDPDDPPRAVVHDYNTDPVTSPASMVLFLYEVAQDPATRNRPPLREEAGGNIRLRKPPLTLVLRYLLTPFAGDRLTEQRMLARTMQALYDQPIRFGPDLRGEQAPDGLLNSNASLKLHLALLTLEERTRIWNSIQRRYRLSVVYEVRLAELDADSTTEAPAVRTRLLEGAEPVA